MKLLRRKIVSDLTGLARSTLYAAIKNGEFPKPVLIGRRAVAWRSDEVEVWMNARQSKS
jgi:prophage regulatory protein